MNKKLKLKEGFLLMSLLVFPLLAEKILVLPWASLGMEIDPTKAKVSTKIFAGELAKEGKYQVIEGDEPCEKIECAIEKGKEKGVDIVILGSLNRLETRKYFFEIKSIEVLTGTILYVTQYPLENLENLDVAIKLLAKAFLQGRQAEDVAMEQEGGWKRKARVAPSVRFGYNYFVGENSYRREHAEEYRPDPIWGNFAEAQPQRAFDLDLTLTYYMTNTVTVDFTARFEFENRGMQLLVPLNYFFTQTDISPFAQGGILFGFGPPMEERSTDYWSSQRDGFGFVIGAGILFFRSYDFNLIFNPRYTVIFNKIVDQGIGFTFGIVWAPKTKF